jgi:hypothetical protein
VVNYRGGSGQGRLKQWRNSARLVARSPVLGVGPGNWSVRYPAVAPAGDPSLARDGTTANPWPSSDWVAFASERGLLGVGALGAAFALLLWRAHQLVWRAATADERLRGGALGAVLAATVTAGAFDAVLLLAAPSFLTWTAVGALGRGRRGPRSRGAASTRVARPGRRPARRGGGGRGAPRRHGVGQHRTRPGARRCRASRARRLPDPAARRTGRAAGRAVRGRPTSGRDRAGTGAHRRRAGPRAAGVQSGSRALGSRVRLTR